MLCRPSQMQPCIAIDTCSKEQCWAEILLKFGYLNKIKCFEICRLQHYRHLNSGNNSLIHTVPNTLLAMDRGLRQYYDQYACG